MKKLMLLFLCIAGLSMFAAEVVNAALPSGIIDTRKEWIESVNNSKEKIESFYFKDAVLFAAETKNRALSGPKNISDYYSSLSIGKITGFETVYFIKYDVTKYFEVTKLNLENGDSLYIATEWEKFKKKWGINFEIASISLTKNGNATEVEIKEAANQWLIAANAGNVAKLCEELYGDNAFFIGNEIAEGSKAIFEIFNPIMGEKGYSIATKDSSFIYVSNNVVFEIGKYETPFGNGNYIFVWRKNADGKWFVGMDRG